MIETEEHALIEKLVLQSAIELSQNPFSMVLPGAMKCQVIRCSGSRPSTAFEVNSMPRSQTITPGFSRRRVARELTSLIERSR